MATAFVFTHARHASEAATLEAMRRDLLQRGRARFKSVLREEAQLRNGATTRKPVLAQLPFKPRPLRGCALAHGLAACVHRHAAPPLSRPHRAPDARAHAVCLLALRRSLTKPLHGDAAPLQLAAPAPPGEGAAPKAPSRYMIHPLNRWKLYWDWWLLLLARRASSHHRCTRSALFDTPCRVAPPQVLYSAVMVPWSVSFQPSSCGDAAANSAGGACASATITARFVLPRRLRAPCLGRLRCSADVMRGAGA